MNWLLVFYVLISFIVLMSILLTVLMFFRFKRREKEKSPSREAIGPGMHFQRYVPPRLRAVEIDPRAERKRRRRVLAYRLFDFFVLLAGLSVVGASFYLNGDKFHLPIELTSLEQKRLEEKSLVGHKWRVADIARDAKFSELAPAFEKKNVVLIYSDQKQVAGTLGGRAFPGQLIEARQSWGEFFKSRGIEYRQCEWSKADGCRERFAGPTVWVVSLSWWNFEFIERVLNKGDSLILQGPPLQLYAGTMKSLNWQGMSFYPLDASAPWNTHVSLVGDELLTAGANAGQVLEVPPLTNQFYLYTVKPQAVAMGPEVHAGGPVKTRVYADRIGRGRVVWMDYLPWDEKRNEEARISIDQLTARIFRYSLGVGYTALATWPDVARMAVMLSQDVEDRYYHAEKVIGLFRQHDFPITFFALSNESQMNRSLTQKMGLLDKAEMGCHGDSHAPFAGEEKLRQMLRLARCRKTVQRLTGRRPMGFRPPEELFDDRTIDALAELRMSYFFGSSSSTEAVPKILYDSDARWTLVSLPRISSDDYELWYRQDLDEQRSFARMRYEADWVSMIGGLYTFSFHSQYIGDTDNFNALEKLLSYFSKMNVWRATGGQISAWWRFRKALMAGEEVEERVFATFRPHLIEVSATGELRRKPLGFDEHLKWIKSVTPNKDMRSLSAWTGEQ